ncbi:MAG: beta-N-acetylhexosaminidase [Phycisphaeraceae bacterium JB051]
MQDNPLMLIPNPVSCKVEEGHLSIKRDWYLMANEPLLPDQVTLLQDMLQHALPRDYAARYQTMPNGHAANLLIQMDPEVCEGKAEASIISIKQNQIQISATDQAGLFYAMQSLVQLIGVAGPSGQIPCCTITDYPRYAWRGFMLDSARHFQSVQWIKRHIDRMAAIKLNRLHWHLCDDEGWRAQIKAYPRLTEVAAWRTENGERYGGYYTQQQMRDIVQYAKVRHITVIPEIEMPGHCNSALVAYPEFSCSGKAIQIGEEGWDAYKQIAGRLPYCAAKPAVFAFLKTVLSEMAQIFDHHLHIGGDETPGEKWDNCPLCSALKSKLGFKDNIALRTHFLNQIHDHCTHTLGRQSIVWTDGVDERTPKDQIVHAWHAHEAATAARLGHHVINSNHEWVYLDYPPSDADKHTKPDWMLVLPLEKVYHFDPTPEGLEPEHQKNILGSESPIWTEHAPDEIVLEKHIFPRLIAFAEALWSPRWGRSFDEFKLRLELFENTSQNNHKAHARPVGVTA